MSCEAPRDNKEHDACLVEQFNSAFLFPTSVAVSAGSVTPAQASQLLTIGEGLLKELCYGPAPCLLRRQESETNWSIATGWPTLKRQLTEIAARQSSGQPVSPGAPGGSVGQAVNNFAASLTKGNAGLILLVIGVATVSLVILFRKG